MSVTHYTTIDAPLFAFNTSAGKWEPTTVAHGAEQTTTPAPCTARFATFNVLADLGAWHVRRAILSKKRYAALPEHLESLDADVIALHDVTHRALSAVLDSEFIRSWYRSTAVPQSFGEDQASCVILTRLRVSRVAATHIGHEADGDVRMMPLVSLPMRRLSGDEATVDVVVGALQVLTPDRTHEGVASRTQALAWASEAARAWGGDDIVLLADTNAQHDSDEGALAPAGLLDVWAETHFCFGDDQELGNTSDPARNQTLVAVDPGVTVASRADRILLGKGGCISPSGSALLWATQALPAFDPEELATWRGRVGLTSRAFGLYLSHRFGVMVDVKCGRPFHGDERVAEVIAERSRKAIVPPKPTAVVDAAFSAAAHVGWLAARLVGQR